MGSVSVIRGDLFGSNAQTLVNTVNCVGVSLVLSWLASSANSTLMSSCTLLSMQPTVT